MKLDRYLTEAKLKSNDKKILIGLIKRPKNTDILLSSYSDMYDEEERTVEVKKGKNKTVVTFTFNADFYELQNDLIDFVDSITDLQFAVDIERPTNTVYFSVVHKPKGGRYEAR